MLPLPYTPRRANGLLAQRLKFLRAQLPPDRRTRVVRGRREEYVVHPKAISDGAQATARVLLFWALDAVEQVRQVPALQQPGSGAPLPPPVATNNETLASFRQVSARAIRAHLTELRGIGFIQRKVFRGTKANFEVYINPEFLWKTPENALAGPKNAENQPAGAAAPAAAPATNVPLIVSLEKQDNKEIEIGQVEKLVPHEAPTGADDLTGNTGPQAPPKPAPTAPAGPRPAKQATKSGAGAAGGAAPASAEKPAPAAARLEAERLAMVRQTFFYAWKCLYPSCHFDSQEQLRALEAIWNGTYRGFAGAYTPAQWARYHDEVLQRIDLAAGYFARHENKFPPAPYAQFVAGTGYFDQANAYGFEGTHRWLRKHLASRRQRSLSDALLKARRELKAHRLGIARPRAQALTTLQLYRHHEAKIRPFGPEALKRFYAQVAQPAAQPQP